MSLLFSPLKVGPLTLKNRIVVPPMAQYSAGSDGVVAPWHAQHLGSLAISGAGMVISEAMGVTPDGRITPHCLGLWNDAQTRALQKLLTDIRTYSDTPIGAQLNHAGRKASTSPPWIDHGAPLGEAQGGWHTVAPSAIPWRQGGSVPEALDEPGMERIVQAFIGAARRALEAGVDFAELQAANGYLLSQFLSPLSNQRRDDYGGSPENRMRFPLRVARALREIWPTSLPLGVRFNGGEFADGGLELAEAVQFARELHRLGYDYLSVSGGCNVCNETPTVEQQGYMVPFAAAVKAALPDAIVMTVGMIHDAERAEAILQERKADLIAVGRGILDDPRWPIHAALAMGERAGWPKPYDRFGARGWPGHQSPQV